MKASGKNRTPNKLPTTEREPLDAACAAPLKALLNAIKPEWAVGVGVCAEKCLQRVVYLGGAAGTKVTRILHPSPASPAANRGWTEAATAKLD